MQPKPLDMSRAPEQTLLIFQRVLHVTEPIDVRELPYLLGYKVPGQYTMVANRCDNRNYAVIRQSEYVDCMNDQVLH